MEEHKEVPELFNKYRKHILSIAVILAALLIAFNIYKRQGKELALLNSQKEDEIKRNQVLEDINRLKKRLDLYKGFLNNKDISGSLIKINNIARKTAVNIASITPLTPKETSYCKIYPFDLSVSAGDYHAIAKFISEMENSPDIYIVNLLSITAQGASESGQGQQPELKAGVQISTILYKD